MTRLLERALFPRRAATNLAVMRVLIGSFACWFLIEQRAGMIATCTKTPLRYFEPVGVIGLLSGPIDGDLFRALYAAATVLAFTFTLGALSWLLAPLFALVLLFVLSYRQSWGFIYHTENLLIVHVAVLALTRSSDVLSIDRYLGRYAPWTRKLGAAGAAALPSWRYGWPAQLMVLITGVTYWVAGMAKLGAHGIAWALDAHLLDHIGNNALRYHFLAGGAAPITYHVYAWPSWVWIALGSGSIALELAAPLAVLGPRVAVPIAALLFSFHWSILFVMGIPFVYQLYGFAYVPFVPWDRLASALRRRLTARRRPR